MIKDNIFKYEMLLQFNAAIIISITGNTGNKFQVSEFLWEQKHLKTIVSVSKCFDKYKKKI